MVLFRFCRRFFLLIGLVSYLFSALALVLLADALFLGGSLFRAFPLLTAPVAGLCGFLTALVWYLDIKNRVRAKKKRTKAMVAMVVSLSACLLSLIFLLFRLFL